MARMNESQKANESSIMLRMKQRWRMYILIREEMECVYEPNDDMFDIFLWREEWSLM